MLIKKNVSLKGFNTFAIDATTTYFTELTDINQIHEIKRSQVFQENPLLILGGGSNVLFINDFQGLVIRVMLKGIRVEKETSDEVFVTAMAGEGWESFVEYCVSKQWGGIENLTLIPGNVGTSPMQNIGAYGVELKDVFYSLQAYELDTGEILTFYNGDCQFGYRDSFFKKEGKGKFIILSVCFRLTKTEHRLNNHYGAVRQELEMRNITKPNITDIMLAIQHIRRSKLPDPIEIGNAGSFFKNPLIDIQLFDQLVKEWPDMPAFEDPTGKVKTAAAWLIEKAGWKGFRDGDAGVHQKQALVIVNYGNASGRQILSLSRAIQESVKNKFNVHLEPEVNIIAHQDSIRL